MKKLLLTCLIAFLSVSCSWSQCVPSCTNYVALPITFTTYPAAGTNAIPQFIPNTDDGYTPPVPIGFPFTFYCTTYTSVLVYTNGLLQFDIGAPSTFPAGYDAAQLIPSTYSPTILNGIVAFKMDDLDPGVGGSVTYTTLGVSPNRMFVLTYSNVPIYGQAALLNTGQIVLFETTNLIEIHSGSAPLSPNLATQGIEDATGVFARAAPGRNQSNWSASNSAYQFVPVTPVPPAQVSGTQLLCQGTQGAYTSLSAMGATSYTWALPAGWTGISSTTALTATAGASGNVSVAATYTCGTSAATTISVTVNPAPVVSILLADPFIICGGTSFTITPSGAANYSVYPGPATTGPGPLVVIGYTSTMYSLVGSDANNCLSINTATTFIEVLETPTVTVNSGSICLGESFTMIPAGANSYIVSSGFLTVTPNTPGIMNYSITGVGTGTNFCASEVPAISSLTVNAIPVIDILTPRTTICKNETITLSASGASTYSWNSGQTNGTISISQSLPVFSYSVTGISAAGCTSGKTILITLSPCTGIDEARADATGISVFPNPANGVFNVKLDVITDRTVVEIYNGLGQMILSQQALQQEVEIDFKEQSNGLYYLKLKGSDKTVIKLVKQ